MYTEILKKGDLVFDVGLNLGDKSDLYLNLGCRVIGFEPLKECYESALERFRINPNFSAKNIALDKQKGFEKIYLASYHTISSMSQDFINEVKKERFKDYDWNHERIIQTDTLDNMISLYGKPNYIKIDVEGYEYNVLSGLTSQVGMISIEFNPELCEKTIMCIDYIDTLNNGDTKFNYVYRFDEHFKYESWVTKSEIIEYLSSINDYGFEFGDVFCKKN